MIKQLCDDTACRETDYQIHCKDANGHIKYRLVDDCVHLSSFIVNTLEHNAVTNLLCQALSVFNTHKINRCQLTVNSNIASHTHNSQAIKSILDVHGFEKQEEDTYINTNIQRSIYIASANSKIIFNLPYEFINELAEEKIEKDPVIHVYFTNDVSKQVTTFVLPDTPSTRYRSKGVLSFELPVHNSIIDSYTTMNITLYTQIMNKHGTFCKKRAGCANILLSKLLAVQEHNTRQNVVTLKFMAPTLNNVEKSKLLLKIAPSSILMSNVSMRPHRINNDLDAEYAAQLMRDYKEQTWRTFNGKFAPTWKCMKNIHAYEYVTELGTFPAPAFHMVEAPQSSEEYWLNAIRVCLRRDNSRYTLKQFGALSDTPENNNYVARIMAECCTLYSNYCKYVTDKVEMQNRNDVRFGHYSHPLEKNTDSFECVRPTGTGDCEDFGLEELIESCEIEDLSQMLHKSLNNLKHSISEHAAMQKIMDARRKYYACAALSGVSSATVDVSEYGKLDRMGAHEYLILFPKAYFHSMLKRWYGKDSHPIMDEKDAYIGNDMEVLVLEGTGMLRPDGRGGESSSQETARQILESSSDHRVSVAFDGLRRMYYYNKNTGSEFYKTITTLFTNEFTQIGKRYMEFAMIYTKNGRGTYSVDFADVTSKSDRPALFVQPEMSISLYSYIKEKLKNLHPITPLQPPVNTTAKIVNPNISVLHIPSKRGQRHTTIEYFARSDQLSPKRIEVLRENALKKSISISIVREPITSTVTGYRIRYKVPI